MMRPHDPQLLDFVFGEGDGTTPEERARSSTRRFVRGLDQLTFDESPSATGRRLTAREALDAYGFDKLVEVATDGSALLSESVHAVGKALFKRRHDDLGLEIRHVAAATQLSPAVVEALEASKRRPIREYEKVARVLGLDERMLSHPAVQGSNQDVAVRLRDLHHEKTALTGTIVVSLAEAAWVAMTQIRLEAALSLPPPAYVRQEDPFYGTSNHPAYRVGYELADKFRTDLKLGEDPILSMRDLLERQLCIPVLQTDLGKSIAGATLESEGRRAIIVNTSGRNQNAFVRRSTLAHELCHLLFDPRQELRDLRVDEYTDLDRREDQVTDPVEQRANAFAVQLLAPQASALRLHEENHDADLGGVMDHFGLSFTAARYQVWNGLKRRVPLESLNSDRRRPEADWEARESYTTVYHPLHGLTDHPSRAGRFSALVLRAAEEGVVSWDTAGEWLFSSQEELKRQASSIRGLYPDLFG